MNKKLLALFMCGITAAAAFTACGKDIDPLSGNSGADSSSNIPMENVEIANFTAPQNGDTIIEMTIRDYGTVKFRLFPEYAEMGVDNFIKLAESGYYDGLTFHRVIKDFMIQGGDPNGNGTGGASTWGGEFDGGTNPHLIHVSGALAYANSGSTATNGSQFYIVTGNRNITDEFFTSYESRGYSFTDNQKAMYKQVGGTPFLDGNYTVFGQVIDGLDIVYKIQYAATDANDKPLLEDVIIESVKVSQYNGEEIKWYISDYDYDDPADAVPVNFTAPEEGDDIVVMDIKDYGTVKFRLFPEYAPKGVENFTELAKSGYYDGLTFHRIISDFMIQGGDPNGNGTGGESAWGDSFDGGTYYNLIHAAGAVSYANSGSTATNGSQFFIVTGEVFNEEGYESLAASGYSVRDAAKEIYSTAGGSPHLDGGYTVFGQVIDGLDIVFEIQNVDTDTSSKPIDDVIINSVKIEKYDGSDLKWYISDYNNNDISDDSDETTEQTSEDNTETDETSSESEEAKPTDSAE